MPSPPSRIVSKEELKNTHILFRSLGSSSSGNAMLIRIPREGYVLIDAGISPNVLKRKLQQEGVIRLERGKIVESQLQAIWVTHEHSDHIRSIISIQEAHAEAGLRVPIVHATDGTFINLKPEQAERLGPYRKIRKTGTKGYEKIPTLNNEFVVRPIVVSHDVAEPVGFIMEYRGSKIAFVTDNGHYDDVYEYIKDADTAFLEGNYDRFFGAVNEETELAYRIRGKKGHASVQDLSDTVYKMARDYGKLQHVQVLHTSKWASFQHITIERIRQDWRRALQERLDSVVAIKEQAFDKGQLKLARQQLQEFNIAAVDVNNEFLNLHIAQLRDRIDDLSTTDEIIALGAKHYEPALSNTKKRLKLFEQLVAEKDVNRIASEFGLDPSRITDMASEAIENERALLSARIEELEVNKKVSPADRRVSIAPFADVAAREPSTYRHAHAHGNMLGVGRFDNKPEIMVVEHTYTTKDARLHDLELLIRAGVEPDKIDNLKTQFVSVRDRTAVMQKVMEANTKILPEADAKQMMLVWASRVADTETDIVKVERALSKATSPTYISKLEHMLMQLRYEIDVITLEEFKKVRDVITDASDLSISMANGHYYASIIKSQEAIDVAFNALEEVEGAKMFPVDPDAFRGVLADMNNEFLNLDIEAEPFREQLRVGVIDLTVPEERQLVKIEKRQVEIQRRLRNLGYKLDPMKKEEWRAVTREEYERLVRIQFNKEWRILREVEGHGKIVVSELLAKELRDTKIPVHEQILILSDIDYIPELHLAHYVDDKMVRTRIIPEAAARQVSLAESIWINEIPDGPLGRLNIGGETVPSVHDHIAQRHTYLVDRFNRIINEADEGLEIKYRRLDDIHMEGLFEEARYRLETLVRPTYHEFKTVQAAMALETRPQVKQELLIRWRQLENRLLDQREVVFKDMVRRARSTNTPITRELIQSRLTDPEAGPLNIYIRASEKITELQHQIAIEKDPIKLKELHIALDEWELKHEVAAVERDFWDTIVTTVNKRQEVSERVAGVQMLEDATRLKDNLDEITEQGAALDSRLQLAQTELASAEDELTNLINERAEILAKFEAQPELRDMARYKNRLIAIEDKSRIVNSEILNTKRLISETQTERSHINKLVTKASDSYQLYRGIPIETVSAFADAARLREVSAGRNELRRQTVLTRLEALQADLRLRREEAASVLDEVGVIMERISILAPHTPEYKEAVDQAIQLLGASPDPFGPQMDYARIVDHQLGPLVEAQARSKQILNDAVIEIERSIEMANRPMDMFVDGVRAPRTNAEAVRPAYMVIAYAPDDVRTVRVPYEWRNIADELVTTILGKPEIQSTAPLGMHYSMIEKYGIPVLPEGAQSAFFMFPDDGPGPRVDYRIAALAERQPGQNPDLFGKMLHEAEVVARQEFNFGTGPSYIIEKELRDQMQTIHQEVQRLTNIARDTGGAAWADVREAEDKLDQVMKRLSATTEYSDIERSPYLTYDGDKINHGVKMIVETEFEHYIPDRYSHEPILGKDRYRLEDDILTKKHGPFSDGTLKFYESADIFYDAVPGEGIRPTPKMSVVLQSEIVRKTQPLITYGGTFATPEEVDIAIHEYRTAIDNVLVDTYKSVQDEILAFSDLIFTAEDARVQEQLSKRVGFVRSKNLTGHRYQFLLAKARLAYPEIPIQKLNKMPIEQLNGLLVLGPTNPPDIGALAILGKDDQHLVYDLFLADKDKERIARILKDPKFRSRTGLIERFSERGVGFASAEAKISGFLLDEIYEPAVSGDVRPVPKYERRPKIALLRPVPAYKYSPKDLPSHIYDIVDMSIVDPKATTSQDLLEFTRVLDRTANTMPTKYWRAQPHSVYDKETGVFVKKYEPRTKQIRIKFDPFMEHKLAIAQGLHKDYAFEKAIAEQRIVVQNKLRQAWYDWRITKLPERFIKLGKLRGALKTVPDIAVQAHIEDLIDSGFDFFDIMPQRTSALNRMGVDDLKAVLAELDDFQIRVMAGRSGISTIRGLEQISLLELRSALAADLSTNLAEFRSAIRFVDLEHFSAMRREVVVTDVLQKRVIDRLAQSHDISSKLSLKDTVAALIDLGVDIPVAETIAVETMPALAYEKFRASMVQWHALRNMDAIKDKWKQDIGKWKKSIQLLTRGDLRGLVDEVIEPHFNKLDRLSRQIRYAYAKQDFAGVEQLLKKFNALKKERELRTEIVKRINAVRTVTLDTLKTDVLIILDDIAKTADVSKITELRAKLTADSTAIVGDLDELIARKLIPVKDIGELQLLQQRIVLQLDQRIKALRTYVEKIDKPALQGKMLDYTQSMLTKIQDGTDIFRQQQALLLLLEDELFAPHNYYISILDNFQEHSRAYGIEKNRLIAGMRRINDKTIEANLVQLLDEEIVARLMLVDNLVQLSPKDFVEDLMGRSEIQRIIKWQTLRDDIIQLATHDRDIQLINETIAETKAQMARYIQDAPDSTTKATVAKLKSDIKIEQDNLKRIMADRERFTKKLYRVFEDDVAPDDMKKLLLYADEIGEIVGDERVAIGRGISRDAFNKLKLGSRDIEKQIKRTMLAKVEATFAEIQKDRLHPELINTRVLREGAENLFSEISSTEDGKAAMLRIINRRIKTLPTETQLARMSDREIFEYARKHNIAIFDMSSRLLDASEIESLIDISRISREHMVAQIIEPTSLSRKRLRSAKELLEAEMKLAPVAMRRRSIVSILDPATSMFQKMIEDAFANTSLFRTTEEQRQAARTIRRILGLVGISTRGKQFHERAIRIFMDEDLLLSQLNKLFSRLNVREYTAYSKLMLAPIKKLHGTVVSITRADKLLGDLIRLPEKDLKAWGLKLMRGELQLNLGPVKVKSLVTEQFVKTDAIGTFKLYLTEDGKLRVVHDIINAAGVQTHPTYRKSIIGGPRVLASLYKDGDWLVPKYLPGVRDSVGASALLRPTGWQFGFSENAFARITKAGMERGVRRIGLSVEGRAYISAIERVKKVQDIYKTVARPEQLQRARDIMTWVTKGDPYGYEVMLKVESKETLKKFIQTTKDPQTNERRMLSRVRGRINKLTKTEMIDIIMDEYPGADYAKEFYKVSKWRAVLTRNEEGKGLLDALENMDKVRREWVKSYQAQGVEADFVFRQTQHLVEPIKDPTMRRATASLNKQLDDLDFERGVQKMSNETMRKQYHMVREQLATAQAKYGKFVESSEHATILARLKEIRAMPSKQVNLIEYEKLIQRLQEVRGLESNIDRLSRRMTIVRDELYAAYPYEKYRELLTSSRARLDDELASLQHRMRTHEDIIKFLSRLQAPDNAVVDLKLFKFDDKLGEWVIDYETKSAPRAKAMWRMNPDMTLEQKLRQISVTAERRPELYDRVETQITRKMQQLAKLQEQLMSIQDDIAEEQVWIDKHYGKTRFRLTPDRIREIENKTAKLSKREAPILKQIKDLEHGIASGYNDLRELAPEQWWATWAKSIVDDVEHLTGISWTQWQIKGVNNIRYTKFSDIKVQTDTIKKFFNELNGMQSRLATIDAQIKLLEEEFISIEKHEAKFGLHTETDRRARIDELVRAREQAVLDYSLQKTRVADKETWLAIRMMYAINKLDEIVEPAWSSLVKLLRATLSPFTEAQIQAFVEFAELYGDAVYRDLRAIQAFDRLKKDVVDVLGGKLPRRWIAYDMPKIEPWSKRWVRATAKGIDGGITARMSGSVEDAMGRMYRAITKIHGQDVEALLPGIRLTVDPKLLEARVARINDYVNIAGLPVDTYWKNIEIQRGFSVLDMVDKLERDIKDGKAVTTAIDDLIRSFMDQEDGKVLVKGINPRMQAEILAKDISYAGANLALEDFYQQNNDVFEKVKRITILDGNTCQHCRSLAGKTYLLEEPRPAIPAHSQCRCLYVGILVSLHELRLIGLDTKQIDELSRIVPTYEPKKHRMKPIRIIGLEDLDRMYDEEERDKVSHQWLAWAIRKNPGDQNDILGPSKAATLRSGLFGGAEDRKNKLQKAGIAARIAGAMTKDYAIEYSKAWGRESLRTYAKQMLTRSVLRKLPFGPAVIPQVPNPFKIAQEMLMNPASRSRILERAGRSPASQTVEDVIRLAQASNVTNLKQRLLQTVTGLHKFGFGSKDVGFEKASKMFTDKYPDLPFTEEIYGNLVRYLEDNPPETAMHMALRDSGFDMARDVADDSGATSWVRAIMTPHPFDALAIAVAEQVPVIPAITLLEAESIIITNTGETLTGAKAIDRIYDYLKRVLGRTPNPDEIEDVIWNGTRSATTEGFKGQLTHKKAALDSGLAHKQQFRGWEEIMEQNEEARSYLVKISDGYVSGHEPSLEEISDQGLRMMLTHRRRALGTEGQIDLPVFGADYQSRALADVFDEQIDRLWHNMTPEAQARLFDELDPKFTELIGRRIGSILDETQIPVAENPELTRITNLPRYVAGKKHDITVAITDTGEMYGINEYTLTDMAIMAKAHEVEKYLERTRAIVGMNKPEVIDRLTRMATPEPATGWDKLPIGDLVQILRDRERSLYHEQIARIFSQSNKEKLAAELLAQKLPNISKARLGQAAGDWKVAQGKLPKAIRMSFVREGKPTLIKIRSPYEKIDYQYQELNKLSEPKLWNLLIDNGVPQDMIQGMNKQELRYMVRDFGRLKTELELELLSRGDNISFGMLQRVFRTSGINRIAVDALDREALWAKKLIKLRTPDRADQLVRGSLARDTNTVLHTQTIIEEVVRKYAESGQLTSRFDPKRILANVNKIIEDGHSHRQYGWIDKDIASTLVVDAATDSFYPEVVAYVQQTMAQVLREYM